MLFYMKSYKDYIINNNSDLINLYKEVYYEKV